MADTLKEFLVSIGFGLDKSSQLSVETATKATEQRITAANVAEAAKRLESVRSANVARVAAAVVAGKTITDAEKKLIAEEDKLHKDADSKKRKSETDADKRARDRQDKSIKDVQIATTKIASFVKGLQLTMDGVIGGLTFAAIERTARGFESLYYASRRIGASSQNLTAASYASSQLGSSVEEASASMEAFGLKLRQNQKGWEGFLSSLGVKTRDASGQLKDATRLADDLFTVLRKDVGTPEGLQRSVLYAQNLGFSENEARARLDPRYEGLEASRAAQQHRIGVDPQASLRAGVNFELSFRRLSSVLEDIWTRIATAVMPKIQTIMDWLSNWVTAHGKDITEFFNHLVDGIVFLTKTFSENKHVQDALKELSAEFDQLIGYLGSDKFKNDIKDFVRDVGYMAHAIRKALEWLGILPDGSETSHSAVPKFISALDGEMHFARAAYRGRASTGLNTDQEAADTLDKWGAHGAASRVRGKVAQNANSAAIIDELKKAGLPDEGVAAVVGSMQTESSFRPNAHNDVSGGHTGLIQWDSIRWPKVEAWIKSQGGDPMDPRWQTRAFVAEGRSKPGDPLYDSKQTQQGFSDLQNSTGDVDKAVHGMYHIERFGPGEEGGRAANARAWLPKFKAPVTPVASATQSTAPAGSGTAPLLSNYVDKDGVLSDANKARYDRDRAAYSESQSNKSAPVAPEVHDYKYEEGDKRPGVHWLEGDSINPHTSMNDFRLSNPLGVTPSMQSSIDNSRTRGDTTITHNPTFNISGGSVQEAMTSARLTASRGSQDLLRNLQGAEA